MDDETLRILSMIENGKISAEQGAELQRALGKKGETAGGAPVGASAEAAPGARRPTIVGIYVTGGGQQKEVKVKIPMGLVDMLDKFLPKGLQAKMQAGGHEFDMSELLRNIKGFAAGEILCVDTDDGKQVRICCE